MTILNTPMGNAPVWTDRSGKPTKLAMTMRAPFILIVDGHEVENFGADEDRALAVYDARCEDHYRARGLNRIYISGGAAL